jgi:hypothetical protein
MDSFARTGKSNRVLPAYQEVRLKAKRRAVSADLSLAKRAAASRITRHFGTTAIPATVSVPLSLMSYSPNVPPCWRVGAHSPQHFQFWQLYHFGHTLLMFGAVGGLVWALKRLPMVKRLGCPIHILIDVSTHPGNLRNLFPLTDFILGIRWHARAERLVPALHYGVADIGFRGSMDAGEAVVFRCDLS